MTRKTKRLILLSLCLLLALGGVLFALAEGDTDAAAQSPYFGTWLSLLPPLIAIALALIFKEVYISLFVGILAGGLLYANFHPVDSTTAVVGMMTQKLGDGWNVGILMFLVILGIIVVLMNKAGGSRAYGQWAAQRIRTKRGALLSTFGLGVLIFVDDYFNCLTVGGVMAPVTDRQKISRAKLAYIIDATAAPICIIAPISSWAAAVTSSVPEDVGIDGFKMFLMAIPFNLYALMTILMVIFISAMKLDFGPMKKAEKMAEAGHLFAGSGNVYAGQETQPDTLKKGKVIDLVLPILSLIALCILGMIYTGGFFDAQTDNYLNFITAFADSDASVGLALGSLVSLLLIFIWYVARRVLSLREFADSVPEGFRQMVPAIVILTFAWTLSGLCTDGLGIGEFVGGAMDSLGAGSDMVKLFIPAIVFLVALGLAFATGTSWGTFGILIPIVLAVFPQMDTMTVIAISACLAGAVCGDHISPISDTTIMASSGAQCNHIQHVSTQIPYALLVAAVSTVGYVLAGFIQNAWIILPICAALLIGALMLIKTLQKKKAS